MRTALTKRPIRERRAALAQQRQDATHSVGRHDRARGAGQHALRRRVAEAEYGNVWQARCVAPFMAAVFFLTIPGLAVVLVLLAALDRFGMWVHSRSGLPWCRDGHRAAPAPGFDELQAVFQSSKRHAIERRRLESVLRDDEHDGAPPHFRIDSGGGRAVIVRAARRAPADA